MKLAPRTFTLEFKADVARHRKAENLSWTDAGKAFDVLPKLVKEWGALYEKCSRVLCSREPVKYAFIEAELAAWFPIAVICRVLAVTQAGLPRVD